jgi:uncharacterized membrane protein HdeD (DUF308 family)
MTLTSSQRLPPSLRRPDHPEATQSLQVYVSRAGKLPTRNAPAAGVPAKELAGMRCPGSNPIAPGFISGIQDHWQKYLVEGGVLVLLGLAAVTVKALTGAGDAVVLGTLILIGGLVGLVITFHTRRAPATGWSLVSSSVGVLVGVLLLLQPARGVRSLTLVVIGFLLVEGIISIRFAIEHQRRLSAGSGWMLASGVFDLLLSLGLLASLQNTPSWALAGAIALDLIASGWALIAMALACRLERGTLEMDRHG